MRILVLFTVTLAAVAVGLGYVTRVTYPEGNDYPLLVKLVCSSFKLFNAMATVLEIFGWSHWVFADIQLVNNATVDGISTYVKEMAGVRVTFIYPTDYQEKEPGAAMIHFHSGGWIMGSTESDLTYLKHIAKALQVLIISPNYRRAPEFPFPFGFEDSLGVTKEFMRDARSYNVNPNKIILSGESAGGNLAMAVNLALTDPKGNIEKSNVGNICMLHMVYPVLQMTDFALPSYLQNYDPPIWSPYDMTRAVLTYMGLEKHTELIEPLLINAHMEDFKNSNEFNHDKINEKFIPDKYKVRSSSKVSVKLNSFQTQSLERLKSKVQQFVSNPYFAPLTADDASLKLLPRTHVVSCEYDLLRDDSVLLYERMKSLGLQVTHQHLEFAFHGLVNFYGAMSYDKLNKEMVKMFDVINEALDYCG